MNRFFLSSLLFALVFGSGASLAVISSNQQNELTAGIASGDGAAVTLITNRILSGELSSADTVTLESLAASLADAGYRDAAGGLLVRAAELIDAPGSDTERETLVRIAQALQALNLRSSAQSVVSRGIQVTGKSQSDGLNAQSYQLLGDLAFEKGDLDAAADAYASASSSQLASVPTELLVRQIKLAAIQGN